MSDTGADEALVGRGSGFLLLSFLAATGCFSVARSESLINMALLNHLTKEMIAYMGKIATATSTT